MGTSYTEIFKLKNMLDEANIPYQFFDRSEMFNHGDMKYYHYQIIVYKPYLEQFDRNRMISVIEGLGTYGNQEDLLEIMGCLTEEESKDNSVLGYLSAEEVFRRIENNYNRLLEEGKVNEDNN